MTENLNPSWIGEDEMYKENILDHYKEPRNFKVLDTFTCQHREVNPVCGDELDMFVFVEEGIVKDVSFQGKGCAISMASASMLTELVKGKSLEEVRKINEKNVLDMLGITLGIVRMKCGMLGLHALTHALEEENVRN